MTNIRIFGLGDSGTYADTVCKHLTNIQHSTEYIGRSKHREDYQDDGEPYVLSLENVRGADVFIIQSLYNSEEERLADKFLKLALFAASVRDASAWRITLVTPYLAYQRQDRKTESRAPVYTKYIPQMLEGLLDKHDRIVTMDAHNLSAYQTGFRFMIDHLEAKNVVSEWLVKNLHILESNPKNLVFASPDLGGMKRTGFYQKKVQSLLQVPISLAAVDKTHEGRKIESHDLTGDVNGRDVFIFDDMISSGTTACQGIKIIEDHGGTVRALIATHGLFVGKCNEAVEEILSKGIKIIVTDTVRPFKLKPEYAKQLIVIPTAELFANAIHCIHSEESISKLLQ